MEAFVAHPLPMVYACSGCSSAGQAANDLAVRLDRAGLAEMGCTSGVGAGVAPLVRKAQAAERVLAVDGCPLHCALHSLRAAGVEPAEHWTLTERGVKKAFHQDPTAAELDAIYQAWVAEHAPVKAPVAA
jgi:uncharacterized metal-binding protein